MSRANACTELTRFWLQARHRCLVDESLAVPVPHGLSDIDLIAIRADLTPFALPDGTDVGPRIIVETKDEHDWDPAGRDFGARLRADVELMEGLFIPTGSTGVKFTMLRQQHFEAAVNYFGATDFDRVFVVHALDPVVRADLTPLLAQRRIFWLTVPELVRDLLDWYSRHPRPSGLRYSAIGDVIHLLVGYCGLRLPSGEPAAG
ncbi:MAG: hypothetical protein M3173_00115 [Chloroflexota bacterium]|nr:hypothetical protein [Chloroflexota bacterium]